METFTVTTETVHEFRAGWGVAVFPIYSGDENDGRVSDVDLDVVEITAAEVRVVGGVPCVHVFGCYVPADSFEELPDLTQDDSHDLRTRWFATREEAASHAKDVRDLWDNPNPWTAFVVLS